MIKIRILSVGKTKEPWLEEALDEYLKRLKPALQIEFAFAKNDTQLLEWLAKESARHRPRPSRQAADQRSLQLLPLRTNRSRRIAPHLCHRRTRRVASNRTPKFPPPQPLSPHFHASIGAPRTGRAALPRCRNRQRITLS